MRSLALFMTASALALSTPAFAKGNPESGKAKAAQVCAACHGPDGAKPSAPDQPLLAGQYWFSMQKSALHFQR